VGIGLEVERALTAGERRRLLDAADMLLTTGSLSKDRKRFRRVPCPRRKGFRPFRNRAVIYALIETGMRRSAITRLNLDDVNAGTRSLTVTEKGGLTHKYQISHEGLRAIQEYVAAERQADAEHWNSPALFLAAASRLVQRVARPFTDGNHNAACPASTHRAGEPGCRTLSTGDIRADSFFAQRSEVALDVLRGRLAAP
jgi:integrase